MATNRTTDNFGIPVGSDVHSLTLGADGPTLLLSLIHISEPTRPY